MDTFTVYAVWRKLDEWELVSLHSKPADAKQALIYDVGKWTVPAEWKITTLLVDK